jgi:hypothetical protein
MVLKQVHGVMLETFCFIEEYILKLSENNGLENLYNEEFNNLCFWRIVCT